MRLCVQWKLRQQRLQLQSLQLHRAVKVRPLDRYISDNITRNSSKAVVSRIGCFCLWLKELNLPLKNSPKDQSVAQNVGLTVSICKKFSPENCPSWCNWTWHWYQCMCVCCSGTCDTRGCNWSYWRSDLWQIFTRNSSKAALSRIDSNCG